MIENMNPFDIYILCTDDAAAIIMQIIIINGEGGKIISLYACVGKLNRERMLLP